MSRLNVFLAGVRVLDLSRRLPGPLATLFLADMGAEVIKIEPPAGDELAAMGPRDAQGRPVYYDAINRGKTVRRLDLTTGEGRDEFVGLARGADVVVEGFRPGTLERLQVGFAALRAVNERLICCSINGYGRGGPLSQAAGHDANYLAQTGILYHNGPCPNVFDPPLADCSGALFAVTAILGALQARARDGRGCTIELALADVAMPLQVFQLAEYSAAGVVAAPGRGPLNGGLACYRVYRTADGRHVALAALEPKFWKAFCDAAARPDWIPRHDEPRPQTALTGELAAYFAALPLADLVARFEPADCCLSPVLDLAEAVASPHHQARGLVRRDPSGQLQALFPALVDGAPPSSR